nr:ABC transporter substrate-binding protein [Micromonospora sp. DSM 115978]
MSTFLNYVPFVESTPAFRTYLDAMTRYAPEMQPPDNEVAISSYIATDMFLRGLEEAGACPSREAFIEGLRAVSDYDAGGLLAGGMDLERDFGKISTCFVFVQANAQATAFDLVENNTP